MVRITDRIALLEKLLTRVVELARTFRVPVSLRLMDQYDAVVAEALAACGHNLAPDAVPLLDGSEDDWAEYAPRAQARLIAIGQAHMDGVAEREAARIATELAATAPAKPQRKATASPEFIRHPSVFDAPARN